MNTWYLKYEKLLYELTPQQAEEVRQKIERGGKIWIRGNVFMAGKCELIDILPHNRDEYQIVATQREQLPQPTVQPFEKRSPQEQAEVRKILNDMRKDLTEKLGWDKKVTKHI